MQIQDDKNNITIYQSSDGKISFNVNVFEENVWLTQKQMAELFDRDRVAITQHINNIFKEGELDKILVCKDFLHTAEDGKKYQTQYYNLDVIISVGYRVKSQRGTQFRIWATKILKSYMMNGYAINEDRIRAIEEKIDKLSFDLKSELREEFRKEFKEINQSLLAIANRSIAIHNYNQISLTSSLLEDKIIELLNELLDQAKANHQSNKSQLEEIGEIKKIIKSSPKDPKAKNKLINFFKEMGDQNSDLYKTIQGLGTAKKAITELVKLGQKLINLI